MSEKARQFILIVVAVTSFVCLILYMKQVPKEKLKNNEFTKEYVYRIAHNNSYDYTNSIDEGTPGVIKYTNEYGEEVRVYGNFAISKGTFKRLK